MMHSYRQGALQLSPLAFFPLGEQGLDTLTVVWQSALNSARFSVPDRLLVLLAASHGPHDSNLYLQSPDWGSQRGHVIRPISSNDGAVPRFTCSGLCNMFKNVFMFKINDKIYVDKLNFLLFF